MGIFSVQKMDNLLRSNSGHFLSFSRLDVPFSFVVTIVSSKTPLTTGRPMTFAKGFRKTDLRRAISSATEEGLEVKHAEIRPDGTIRLTFNDQDAAAATGWEKRIA